MWGRLKIVAKEGLKRLAHSVFFRLLATIIIAGIALNISILISFIVLKRNIWQSWESHLIRYARYMAAEIGIPPDRSKAMVIARQTHMTMIQYLSPTENWEVPDRHSSQLKDTLPSSLIRNTTWIGKNGLQIGRNNRGRLIRLAHGDGELLFALIRPQDTEQRIFIGLLLLCATLKVILACAYLYIRRVMQPIRWLTHAMSQIGQGNLSYRVPLKRNDEFQTLAEATNQMAAQLESMVEAKERLLLDVSHELRSPIARLKVGLELLSETKTKVCLQADLREMETMLADILNARRLSRSTAALNFETVESAAFIWSVVQEFYHYCPGIKIFELGHHRLSLDPKKARVVLRNIIDTALKYGSNASRPIELTTSQTDKVFNIHIVDHGIGIPLEAQDRIFEPFFRADASRSRQTGGFGLGLSLSKAIMDAHGGDIKISSSENQGTKVTIIFPLNQS